MTIAGPVVSRRIKDWFINSLGNRGGIGFIQKHSSLIAAISLIAPVIISGISFAYNHSHEIPAKLREAKIWVLKQVIPPNHLSQREIVEWYAKKVEKIILTAALITATVAAIYVLAKLGVFYGAGQVAWTLLNKLSIFRQIVSACHEASPSIVYPGYLYIALAHLYQAKRSFDKGEKMMTIKNIFAAAVSFLTIGAMMTGLYEARWHHMSYGLLCMIPSSFTLNVFGGLMTADSILYWLKPMKDNYDFSNIFEKYTSLFVIQLVCMTALEWAAKQVFPAKKSEIYNPQTTCGIPDTGI